MVSVPLSPQRLISTFATVCESFRTVKSEESQCVGAICSVIWASPIVTLSRTPGSRTPKEHLTVLDNAVVSLQHTQESEVCDEPPWHAAHADPRSPRTASRSRLLDRPAHQGALARRPRFQGKHAVSRPAQARTGRAHRLLRTGRERPHPAGLPDHARRPQSAREGSRGVAHALASGVDDPQGGVSHADAGAVVGSGHPRAVRFCSGTRARGDRRALSLRDRIGRQLSLIHISEPTRLLSISY